MSEINRSGREAGFDREQYPDPLSLSKQDFVDFWTETLTGLHKSEWIEKETEELAQRLSTAKANYAKHEAYLLSLDPTITQAFPERLIESLLGQIYDRLKNRTVKKEDLSSGEMEQAKSEIRRDFAQALIEDFDNLNNEEVDFAPKLQGLLRERFPNLKIEVEREEGVYKCKIGKLFYLQILYGYNIPTQYEKFYPGTQSFSKAVKRNKRPAIGMEEKGKYVVVEEGEVEV